jgi:hypothetical protein
MAKIIGQDVEVALTKESVRGIVATAQSTDWIARGTLEVTPVKEIVEIMVNEGRITTRREIKAVHFENEITITMPMDRKHVGKYLMAFFGSVATQTATPQASTNTHTYAILDTGYVPSYTVTVLYGGEQYQYALGVASNVKVELTTDAEPKLSVTFLTKKHTTTTGLTPSYPANSYFSPIDTQVYSTLTYAGIGDGNEVSIREASIEYTRDVKKMKYLGSDTYENAIGADFDVKAHIVKDFDEETWASGDTTFAHEDYLANTTRALRVKLTDTATTIGASTNPTITFDIPSAKFTEYKTSPELKEIVGEEYDVMPFDDGTNDVSIVTLINDITAY